MGINGICFKSIKGICFKTSRIIGGKDYKFLNIKSMIDKPISLNE